jgi:hypothetical protein
MKGYNVKLYDLSGNYVRTFSPSEIMSEITFSSQTDGGQWELRLKLAYRYDSQNVAFNNVVKVFELDEANPLGRQIYTGFIGSVRRVAERGTEYVEARIVGVASVLSWLFYKSWASYSFSKTDDPANIAKEIIGTLQTQYPWLLNYDALSVMNYGTNVTVSFAYEKCLDSLKKTTDLTDYWWTVDGTGKFHFKPKSAGNTHYLTFWKDIDSLEIEENAEKVVNEYFLDWASWTVSASDSTSQTANGKRQLKESETTVGASGTASSAATKYIAQNKDPKKRIVLTVNTKYDFESMKPGDLVTVRNLEYPIQGLQILRMDYSPNSAKLELDDVRSLPQEIFSQ